MGTRRTILILAIGCAVPTLRATHIIGGELYYEHIGGDDYQVTLKLYRDCAAGITTPFDLTAEIGVFDLGGTHLFSSNFNFPGSVPVPVIVANPCLTVPPVVCVEVADYTGVITLPSGTGGYRLAYQRCCRSANVANLDQPDTQGLTCTVTVPDASVTGANSSPHFTFEPSVAMCVNDAVVFDHSAVDPDGDLLTYELIDPFQGADQFNPMPSPPAPPPYQPVVWLPPYSAAYPMDAAPAMAIDAATGSLTGTPTMLGLFVVGVVVREFRAGVQLSEVRRDLRVGVVPCTVNVTAAIQPQQSLCTGLTIDFVNNSSGSSLFHWDFGDASITTDTSSAASPTYAYADTGTYTVTLIANPGWPCADTTTEVFEVHLPLDPVFIPPPITCFDRQPVEVTATGNFTAAASVEWDLGALGTLPIVTGNPGVLSFTQPGTHNVVVTVEEFGCTQGYLDTVTIHPNPVALFSGDTAGCVPLDVQFTDLSSAWTPMTWKWAFGDAGASTLQHPQHLYMSDGLFDVALTVTTTSGCIDTVTRYEPGFIEGWRQPVAGFLVSPPTVNIIEPEVLITDHSTDAVQWSYWVLGEVFTDPTFTYTFPDAGEFIITQVVSTSALCMDTATRVVIVRDHLFHAPNAFTPDGDGVNEFFMPAVKGAREYQLLIFDRWGRVIFETTSQEEGWSGEGSPPEVYAFEARIVTFGGARKDYFGHVTLVR